PIVQTEVIRIELATSTDGGQTWTSFGGFGNLPNPATTNPVVAFTQSTDASVAFDRNHNFYVVFSEHTGDSADGAIVLQKFNVSGGTVTQVISDKVIYEWIQDPAFQPFVAVDSSVASFADPETGAVRT